MSRVDEAAWRDFVAIEREAGKLQEGGQGASLANEFPKTFSIAQNFPNPFNPSTTIQYEIPERGISVPVEILVFDLRGRLVRRLVDEENSAGRYAVHWDGRGDEGETLPSGVYLYRIEAGEFVSTRKMILVR